LRAAAKEVQKCTDGRGYAGKTRSASSISEHCSRCCPIRAPQMCSRPRCSSAPMT
jgi:hypothetical protein